MSTHSNLWCTSTYATLFQQGNHIHTMKAIVTSNNCTAYTQDARLPKPTPFRNVLVKVFYAGICRTDLGVANNSIEHKDNIVLGHEFCGIIESFYNGEDNYDGWEKGMVVSCNPMMFSESAEKEEMCGKDSDGAFAEYITVPSQALVCLPEHLLTPLGAYLEPVAAALAPINHIKIGSFENICVFGNNRIAELTVQVARCMGNKKIKLVKNIEELRAGSYDCIIETEPQYLNEYMEALRPGGTLILKSRGYKPTLLIPNTVAMKEITIKGCKYGDYNIAAHILAATSAGVRGMLNTNNLFGAVYDLSDYEKAFDEAQQHDQKKIFFKICAE